MKNKIQTKEEMIEAGATEQEAFEIKIFRSCDNCGNDIQDEDEILCRKCKPSLARKAEIKELHAKMDAAYWRFCRCARALPPTLAEPEAAARLLELGEHLQ